MTGAALLLWLVAAESPAEKPRSYTPVTPPLTTVEVGRGGSVRITLEGRERNLNRLEYRIDGNPRHGRLTGLQQPSDPNRQGFGAVTYVHGNDEDSVSDEFTYAVRAPISGRTGRGKVRIRVVDKPSQLTVEPSVLDFGRVVVGDGAKTMDLVLKNSGGGVAQGILEVPPPFRTVTDPFYVLPRGRSAKIGVSFDPPSPSSWSFPVSPGRDGQTTFTVRGEGVAPFSVHTGETRLVLTNGDRRAGTTKVTNNSAQDIQIVIETTPGTPVSHPQSVLVPPGAETPVEFRIDAGNNAPVAGFDARFTARGHAEIRHISADPVPARLEFVAGPDFGEVEPKSRPETSFVLRNSGGTGTDARLQLPENLQIVGANPNLNIPAGEDLEVKLRLSVKNGENLPREFQVVSADKTLNVPVEVVLRATKKKEDTPITPEVPEKKLLALNSGAGVRLEDTTIIWQELNGFTDSRLQMLSSGQWSDYQPPAKNPSWWERIKSIPRSISAFFEKPIRRDGEEFLDAPPPSPEKSMSVDPSEIARQTAWRIAAESKQGNIEAISPGFVAGNNKLQPVEPEPAPEPIKPAAEVVRPKAPSPVTEIVGAGRKAGKRDAVLQVALPQLPQADAYRLERGALSAPIDPETKIPGKPEFVAIEHTEGQAEILAVAEGEDNGRKLTLVAARIDGLPPGSRTYWRIVPSAAGRDLPPTTVIFVDTLPPTPVPWRGIFLAAAGILLVVVLWLRHRANRPPVT